MNYAILDEKRKAIVPLLVRLKNDFYLAGGTGLALQLGHRRSVDFDFFTRHDIDTAKLFVNLKEIFEGGHVLTKIQEERNTLSVLVDGEIKLSFFTYPYPLVEKLFKNGRLAVASIPDIGCMKLNAIISRATTKDYVISIISYTRFH